jgi:hypothetical protein
MTAHKLVQIHINTPNILYYVFLELNIQYEYSMTLIFHKISTVCIKNCHSDKLAAFYVISAS